MHILEGQPYVFDVKEEGHPAFEVDAKQIEDEHILDSELFHVGVHLPQQPEVEGVDNEEPQGENAEEVILQVR